MPKGVVKCGNCEPWDLFKDGNESLVYSISQASAGVFFGTDNMKEGFYYAAGAESSSAPSKGWIVGFGGESSESWAIVESGAAIYQYTSRGLLNTEGTEHLMVPAAPAPRWTMITIDENSGQAKSLA